MVDTGMTPFGYGMAVLITLLSISLIICIYRLVQGPDIPDRTIAFDLISIHAVGIVVLYAMQQDSPEFLDLAIVTAVLGFLGTVMFARFMEQAGQD